MTLREQLIAALEKRGLNQVDAKTTKYAVFNRPKGGFYYVGDRGALRYGLTVAGSLAASDSYKTKLLKGEVK